MTHAVVLAGAQVVVMRLGTHPTRTQGGGVRGGGTEAAGWTAQQPTSHEVVHVCNVVLRPTAHRTDWQHALSKEGCWRPLGPSLPAPHPRVPAQPVGRHTQARTSTLRGAAVDQLGHHALQQVGNAAQGVAGGGKEWCSSELG